MEMIFEDKSNYKSKKRLLRCNNNEYLLKSPKGFIG